MFFFNDNNKQLKENNDNNKQLKEKSEDKEILVEYGTVPFVTFICVILSKLAYLQDCGFLPRYEQIFMSGRLRQRISQFCNNGQPVIHLDEDDAYNPIPTSALTAIKDAHFQDIFNDQKIFKNCKDIDFYTDSSTNNKYVDFIKYAKFFNLLNGSTNKKGMKGGINEVKKGGMKGVERKYVQYISLAWSNYSTVYIVADKRANSIFVVYRGTASIKGIISYINFNSFNKNGPCDNDDDAYIPGVFKITTEVIHTLLESISYLATHFLKATKPNSVKVFATGHSLGGAMATIFAYMYVGIRNNSDQQLATLDKQIVCISVGAPRCINDATLKKYNHFINMNMIMYRRVVTKGDPVSQMPHKAYFGYHHPGDKMKTKNGLEYCQSTYSGLYGNFIDYNKSSNCKTREDQVLSYIGEHNSYDHFNYLYVSYLSLIPTDFRRYEIPREPGSGDTVMRVMLGSNSHDTKVAFFNLVKSRGSEYKKPLLRLITDIHSQDIMMTNKAFLSLISKMKLDNSSDPSAKTILDEEIFDPNDVGVNLNCFTKYNLHLSKKQSTKKRSTKKQSTKKQSTKKGTRKNRV